MATLDKTVFVEFQPSVKSAKIAVREGTIESLHEKTILLSSQDEDYRIPMEEVRRIKIIDPKLGARDGTLAGIVAGAVITSLALVTIKNSGSCDEGPYSSGSCHSMSTKSVIWYEVLGGLIGAGVGGGLGAMTGHRTILDFTGKGSSESANNGE